MEPRQRPVVSIEKGSNVMLSRLIPAICILVAATTVSPWLHAAAANDSGHCTVDVIKQLESQCNNSSSRSYEVVLSEYRAQCCSRALQVLAPGFLQSWIENQVKQFEKQVSTAVNVTYGDPSMFSIILDSQLKGWAEQDLWIIDGASIPFLAYQKELLPLEQKVQDSPYLEWDGFQPLWSDLSVVGGRTVAVPISSDALFMYYRRDMLAAWRRDVPTSWDDLLQLAADWNSSAAATVAAATAAATAAVAPAPQHALCLSTAPNCNTTAWVLSAILASITQQWGPRTGWALALDESDPDLAMQLLSGYAMELGLATLRALAAAGPQGLACGQPLLRFARGECLVTLDLSRSFRLLQQKAAGNIESGDTDGIAFHGSLVRGLVGVALPPGSSHVLDRATGRLVAAEEGACRVPVRRSGVREGTGGTWACTAPMLSYGGTFGVIGRRNGAVYQELAFQFLTWLSSAEAQQQGLADAATAGASAVQPVRESMLEPNAANTLATAVGFDLTDAESYFAALSAAFTSPNVALEFSAPRAFALRSHMDAAIQAYLNGTAVAVASGDMLRAWLAEWSKLNLTVSEVQHMLLLATPGSSDVPERPGKRTGKVVWAIAVGSILGVGLLVALILLMRCCYRLVHGEARLLRIEPPGFSVQTTLVVTDIQDSTKMWELLHSDVMDVAIYQHHSVARRQILRFRGYESATEGDSFIIAFHTADDAVCFCALFQQDLLLVPWPPELLALDGCKAIWMCKSKPEPKRRRESRHAQQQLDVTRSGEPLSAVVLQGCPPSAQQRDSCDDQPGTTTPSPPFFPTQRMTPLVAATAIATRTDADSSAMGLSIGARSPLNGLNRATTSVSLRGDGGSDAAGTISVGIQLATTGIPSPVSSAPVDALSVGGSFPAFGPLALPRTARASVPYTMSGTGSGSGPGFGALGASPRQLSFLGRSLSRLGASSMSIGTTIAALPQVSLLASPAVAMGTLERHSTPRGSIESSYGSAAASAAAAAAGTVSHPGEQDILIDSPTSPVAFGGDGVSNADESVSAAAEAAVARAGFASGAVMSFRESFRDIGGGGGGGIVSSKITRRRDAGDDGSASPPSGQQQNPTGDASGGDPKPPTLTGYPDVSAVQQSRSDDLAKVGIAGCSNEAGVMNVHNAPRPSRSDSTVKRSMSVGGCHGDGGDVGGPAGANGRDIRGRERLSATGCPVPGAAHRSSGDTIVEVTHDRTTNNSRQSRSSEMAIVSDFNVMLESGAQNFVNLRSETDVALHPPPLPPYHQHQQQPPQRNMLTWGPSRYTSYAAAGHLPTAIHQLPPVMEPIPVVPETVTELTLRRLGGGAAVFATGPLGEGAAVVETTSSSPPFSPRAAVRRSFVTFDLQSTGTASDDRAGSAGGSGAAAAGAATSGSAALCTQPSCMSVSSPPFDSAVISSVEQCVHERCSRSSGVVNANSASHPSSVPYRRFPSHLGPGGTSPLPSSRATSLRRRSDITSGSGTATAAAGFTEYPLPYAYAPSGLYVHGHGYDGTLRPSPLGRGASQSSMSSDPVFRTAVRGSHGGGISDATVLRSSNSRSLRGPSVDGEDIGEATGELASYRGQSSPLPQLFPAGTLSDDDESGSHTIRGGAADAATTVTSRPAAATVSESGGDGGSPASPPFSTYTAPRTEVAPNDGRKSHRKRSPTEGTSSIRFYGHQQQQQAHPGFSQQLVSVLGGRVASGQLATIGNASATSSRFPGLSNATLNNFHHNQHQPSGLSRSLLALVSLPTTRVGPAGAVATLPTPESRAASMACMMRLASQHNLQSVGDSLYSRWKVVEEGEPGAQLVFRGLRVRIGMHSGLSEITDLAQLNRTANRMQYTGVGLSMAKAVAECAHGGQVLISGAAFTQLALERLREGVLVLHMGEHRIKDDLPSISLYCGCPRGLQGRLPALRAVRSRQQLSLGVLDAPAGDVVVVFMHVVGAVSLLEWRPDLAAKALEMFRDHVSLELIKYQGYLVEAVDGLVLASFPSPSAGLAWVANCQRDMNLLPWPEELMCHEACEEFCITRLNPSTGVHEDIIVCRGLRLKAGVDVGRLRGEINCVTGRMSYRGRAMNRAARIVAAAGSGQILASSEAWLAAAVQPAARLAGLTGVSMGQFLLKGVAEPIEVYQVKTVTAVVSLRARTVLTRPEGPLDLDELPISNLSAAWQYHMSINNAASPAAPAAAAATMAALGHHVGASSPVLPHMGSITAAGGGVAGSGGIQSRLLLDRRHSMTGGLAAALRQEESMTRRPLSRNVSRRSSRRSSIGSQFSNLAANTMVALARGSLDGRHDVSSSSPSHPITTAAAAAVVAAGNATLGTSVAATAAAAAASTASAAAEAAPVITTASLPGIACSSGSVVPSTARGPRSVSQPQLQGTVGGLTPPGSMHAGVCTGLPSHPVHHSSTSGHVGIGLGASNAGGAVGGGVGAFPYGLPSIGSGTRTSRNSAGEPGCDTDGAHSSNARSSNASNRSGHPMWGHRLTTSLQLPLQQASAPSSHQHPQQPLPAAAAAPSPVLNRSVPAQGIVRHLSALIRSASLALQASSTNTGAKSGSCHPMLPLPAHTRGAVPAVALSPDVPTSTVGADTGISSAAFGQVSQMYRPDDPGLRDSTLGGTNPRRLSTGGGGGGLRDRLPARLRAAGTLFRAGSFSGHVRRRAVEDNRASDFGLTTAAMGPAALVASRETRSPPEAGRRFMSTASGLGYTNLITGTGSAGGGMVSSSSAFSPALRAVAASSGGFYWRREAHAAGAVAAAALGSAGHRQRESRGDVGLLDRVLREGGNSFVIVVGDEDMEGEMDSDGEMDAVSADGDGRAPPPALPMSATLQTAGGSEGGRIGGVQNSEKQQLPSPHANPQRFSGAGPSMTAALMHLNSGRFIGASGGGGGGGGAGTTGGGGGSIALGSLSPELGSNPNSHL